VLLAGNGTSGSGGDGGAAALAQLNAPSALAYGPDGSLYIGDGSAVRKVDPQGNIHSLASSLALSQVTSLYVDGGGTVYVGDSGLGQVLRVDLSGTATVMAGTGAGPGVNSPGLSGTATSLQLSQPTGLGVDALGALYIADAGNNVVYKLDATGYLRPAAGDGLTGASGLTATALTLHVWAPQSLAVGPAGDLYFSCQGSSDIYHVAPSGSADLFAGGLSGAGSSLDGAVAEGGPLNNPGSLVLDVAGTLYFVEGSGPRLRSVVAGRYTTVATLAAAGGGLALGPYGLAQALPSLHQVQLFGACGYSSWAAGVFPVCALSQLKVLQSGFGKPSPVPSPGGRRSWAPLLGPSPARVSGPLALVFPEVVKEGLVGVYDLSGQRIESIDIAGVTRLDLRAPSEPGIYLVWVRTTTDLGGTYERILKLAVLP
jgi:hypothetical protein